jgi:hypothetical protein
VEELREQAAQAEDPEAAIGLLQEALSLEPGNAAVLLDTGRPARWPAASSTTRSRCWTPCPRRAAASATPRCCKRLALARQPPAPGTRQRLAARIAAQPARLRGPLRARGLAGVRAATAKAAFDKPARSVVLRDKADGKPDRERRAQQLIEWFGACAPTPRR